MKHVLFLLIAISVQACQSQQPRYTYQLPSAMREVFRGGQLKGLEDREDPNLGIEQPKEVSPYDLVQHTCVSEPIRDMNGRYVRTAVRCW